MATTTPNFGWAVPTSTDLVKDGAVAIETLGDSIDASLVDLKGGTTNQVLAKNSNTDMDFKWVADASGIPATIIDAKGDLIAGTAADTASRLAVGANGTVLTADSAEATGLKWATPASGGGLTFIKAQTIGSAVSSVTVTDAFSSTYDNYFITVSGGVASTGSNMTLQLGATTTGYIFSGYYMQLNSSTLLGYNQSGANWTSGYADTNGNSGQINLQNPFTTKRTIFNADIIGSTAVNYVAKYMGFLDNSTSYTAFTVATSAGTMTGGTIRVYGYQNS